MREATCELKITEIVAPTAHMCYNAHLIKKVCFGCGELSLTPQEEKMLKDTCEPVM